MNLNKPKNFIPDKNQNGKDWKIWKTEFQIYLALCQGDKKLSMEEQIYILKNLMGKEAEKAIEKIIFDNENDKEDINILLQKFDELFTVSTNEAEERYNFFSKKELSDENIDDYIFDLKEKARKCNFGDQTNKFIKDMVIFHIGNKTLQQILLQQDLTLYEITALYKQHNNSSKKIKEMCDDTTTDTPNEEFRDSIKCMNVNSNGPEDEKSSCWRCGERHPLKSCPAWGTFCEMCEGLHHLTGRCRNGHRSINNSRNRIPKNVCSRCGTRHPFKPCPADHEECSSYENMPNQLRASSESLNVERNGPEYRKSGCWRCGDKHPLNACPAWGKFCEICKDLHHLTGRCRKYTCSKCGTNHPFKQCPAYHEQCSSCLEKGHYSSKCKKSKETNETDDAEESCLWCGTRHQLQSQCPHDATCPTCSDFPHNICFQCRKNPHDESCIFKDFSLPTKIETETGTIYQLEICLWCGTRHHPQSQCPHDATCPTCTNYPHNICFQCRKNPHDESCIFKNMIVLPESTTN